MAAFSPLVTAGSALSKAGQVTKPPKLAPGVGMAGSALLKPQTPKPVKLSPGVSAAGSALGVPNLAGKLAGGSSSAGQAAGGTQTPAPTAGAGGSPLDSTYYQNIADYLFKTQNSINADQAKQTADSTALQGALGQLNYQQPRDQLSLEQKANAGGGLFSSVYGQNLGNLNQKYLTAQNNDTTKYGGDIQSLAATIAGLQGSIPLYNAGQAEASATRAASAAEKNTSLGGTPASSGTVTTHPGGAFYTYYKAVTGKNPPATVSTSSALYQAWQQGTPKSFASLLV